MTADAPEVNDEGAETAEVPEALEGVRVDAAAAQLFPDFSRARLKRWIEDGELTVNGAPVARPRDPVREGDLLALNVVLEDEVAAIEPEDIPLTLVHVDEAVAIVNKPAGLTVHPGAGIHGGTLQNALLHRFPQLRQVPRAGLVHRLDKDTSGLLLIALTLPAHTQVVAALARREIRREYDALVHGTPVSGGTVDAPIGRNPRDRLKMAVVAGGRPSVTHYRVHERYEHQTWLRVRLETGRTHQIRVHMAHVRMPIVGDALYGGKMARGAGMDADVREALNGFPRQALHARELEFTHPVSGERLAFAAEPPADMQSLLQCLRAATPR
jgi:23S rRNA pseudouridine1911/1915/1917 synthase